MEQPKLNPYLVLGIAVVAVSTSAILVKLSAAPAPVIAFYRLFFSVLFMLPFFLAKNVKELLNITRRDWMFSIIAGVFLAFHFILWFESLKYTSVASSTVLVTLQPLFAFVGTFFIFKERISLGGILSCALGIMGSIIISWGDFRISGMALYGDFLALAACVMVTAYLLVGQSIRQRQTLMTYTFVVYGISSITLFLYCVIFQYSLVPPKSGDWIWFILLAVVPTLLGHTLFNWSLKWLSASTISMSILFEPVGAIILAYFILSEKVLPSQIAGGIVIIIGIALYGFHERKAKLARIMENQQGELV